MSITPDQVVAAAVERGGTVTLIWRSVGVECTYDLPRPACPTCHHGSANVKGTIFSGDIDDAIRTIAEYVK